MKTTLLFILLIVAHNAQADVLKFPLHKIGVKFTKPPDYFLLTTENVNELKKELAGLITVCESSKLSFDYALSNPNYQVLINKNNYNELIIFIKFSNIDISKSTDQSIEEILIEKCFSFKNTSINYLGDSKGTLPLGNYSSYLYKVKADDVSYYSESFFVNNRNSTILIAISTINKRNNYTIVNSVENISNERYDAIIGESNKLFHEEKYISAMNKLADAITIDPTNPLAYEKRMSLNLKLTNYNEVIYDANTILFIDRSNINAMLLMGLAKYALKNYNEAISIFDKAQIYYSILTLNNEQNEYFSSFAEIYKIKSEAYILLKNPQKAIENLEAALNLTYDSLSTALVYFKLGHVKSTLQNVTNEAIYFYTLAINYFPINANEEKSEALYNRGLNYRKDGKVHEAIEDYTHAIQIRPDYVKAYNNRAAVKILIEDYKGAISDCDLTIKLDNGLTEFTGMAYYNRGLAKLLIEELNGCEDLKKAKALGVVVSQELLQICF